MKSRQVVLTLLSFAIWTFAHAKGQDSFSLEDWKTSFSKAVQKNDTHLIQKHLNFKDLESKAIPSCVECETKNKIKEARRLFDKGDFAGAEKIYNQIPKKSDYWLQAVEERGWTHFRRENYEKALAQTKTLISPQFVSIVGTEAFFLQSLSQLQVCDYEGLLKTHQLFKEKQKNRILALEKLADAGVNEELKTLLINVNHFPLRMEDFGPQLASLPQLFYRDLEFQRHFLKIKIAQAGLSVLNLTSSRKVFDQLEKLKIQGANQLMSRVQKLASLENQKNRRIVQKLNLLEVEAIQRIHTDMKLSDEMYNKGQFKKAHEDQLIFMDDGQPWIDELDKYDVAVTACTKNIRRKM